MSFSIISIAISIYPVLKMYNESIALAAVVFRIIESMIFILGSIITLLLLTLSLEYVNAGSPDDPYFRVLAELLLKASNEWTSVAAALAFNTGALMYNYIFYKTKLIPRWLSILGLVAVAIALLNVVLTIFGLYNDLDAISLVFHFPTIVFEIILGIWLIIKGFDAAVVSKYAKIKK